MPAPWLTGGKMRNTGIPSPRKPWASWTTISRKSPTSWGSVFFLREGIWSNVLSCQRPSKADSGGAGSGVPVPWVFFVRRGFIRRMVLLGKVPGKCFGARQVPGKLKNTLLAGCGILLGESSGRFRIRSHTKERLNSMNFVSIVLALAVGDEFICCFLHTL